MVGTQGWSHVSETGDYKIVGESYVMMLRLVTYDKVGRVMGLTYPAGREIDRGWPIKVRMYDFLVL